MFGLKPMFTALVVTAFTLPLTFAADTPTPTRKFTVQAYDRDPSGPDLTNYYLSARGGSFYLGQRAPSPQPILNVDNYGQATLSYGPKGYVDTADAKVFVDTVDGHLGYTTSSPPTGAILTNFLHRGAGNKVSTPVQTGVIGPPGDFQWLGSDSFTTITGWLVCGSDLKIYKQMTDPVPPPGFCKYIVTLSALDVKP